jgi:NADPH-dependent 2,4-dienoyl-CoA reductase/sulfur reductase-like enzyme
MSDVEPGMTFGKGERLAVVGGVAAGASAAAQAKRLRPELEVVLFERGPAVSYGACGMPYNLQDPARPIDDLVVFTPERLAAERGIDVRACSEVTELDLDRGALRVRRQESLSEFKFDRLVLATGARAIRPAWDGLALPGVFVLRTLAHAQALKRFLSDPAVRSVVVIGAGHVGLQMADVLCARGLAVTLLRRSPGVPSGYPPEISALVEQELARFGVQLRTGEQVLALEGDVRVRRVVTDRGALPADLVLIAGGVQPEVALAAQAGLRLGASGAIAVDDRLRTSAAGVFAAGDCAESYHLLLKRGVFSPRGTTANKQGRIAGANAAGADLRFRGVLGTSLTRVFSLAVGHTGLDEAAARTVGLVPFAETIRAGTRGRAYPGGKEITVRLVADRPSGRLIGAQLAGEEGVAKRLDVIVAAITAGFDLDDLAALDLSYSPPYAPVWDPILVAANQARKRGGHA